MSEKIRFTGPQARDWKEMAARNDCYLWKGMWVKKEVIENK